MLQQFSTNINCGGCVKAVTYYLQQLQEIENWSVDLTDPHKILSVWGNVHQEKIIDAVSEAGFTIIPLNKEMQNRHV